MIGTKDFLLNFQRPLEQRLGVGIAPLRLVQNSKTAQRIRNVKMVGTNGLLLYRQ